MRPTKMHCEAGFSLVEILISLGIMVGIGAMFVDVLKSCTAVDLKMQSEAQAFEDVRLLMDLVEKDMLYSERANPLNLNDMAGAVYRGFDVNLSDGGVRAYRSVCRPLTGAQLSTQLKGPCFQALNCDPSSAPAVNIGGVQSFPSSNLWRREYYMGIAVCVQPISTTSWRFIVNAALYSKNNVTRVISKERVLSRSAILGNNIELLPNP